MSWTTMPKMSKTTVMRMLKKKMIKVKMTRKRTRKASKMTRRTTKIWAKESQEKQQI